MNSIFVDTMEFSCSPVYSSYLEKNFFQSTLKPGPTSNPPQPIHQQEQSEALNFDKIQTSIAIQFPTQSCEKQQSNSCEEKENITEIEQSCRIKQIYTFESKFMEKLNQLHKS